MSSNDNGPIERSDYNPFEAPRARVDDRPAPAPDGLLVDPPVACSAGRGWGWIARGWGLFSGAPGVWILITLVWLVVSIVMGLIPVVNVLFSFVLIAGMYFAAHSQMKGDGIEVGYVFVGFKRNFGNLVKLALWYLLGVVILVMIAGVIAGVFMSGSDSSAIESGMEPALPAGFAILMLVILGLMIPLIMAIIYAPVLILLHDIKALPAMVLSFRGCLRNVIPSVVFGLVALVLTILAVIPVGLGLLVMLPVMFAALYISYREIFLGEKA